ncbi:hypothetical protein Tco_1502225 [Tanacetum coccineum]
MGSTKLEPLHSKRTFLHTRAPPILSPPLFDENESLTEKETEVTKDKVNNSPYLSKDPSKEGSLFHLSSRGESSKTEGEK